MKIYHQCGHNSVWNRRSFENDGNGSGLIFSPVHEEYEKVKSYPIHVRKASFLDPQFYLPNSQKQKLATYPFFPEVLSGGFSTSDFTLCALEAAKLCVDYQVEQEFDRIIIPARYHEQMISGFCESQAAYSVEPFLEILGRMQLRKSVYLTLPITSHMAADSEFRDNILNWVTGYPEIDGIYLIIASERMTKQITDDSVLSVNLEFLTALKNAGLKVVMGYTNSENLLYSLAGDIELTFGAYENTRMFSLDKFIESSAEQRGPRARIYLPGLFNWIQIEQAREIRSATKDTWHSIYQGTAESEAALNAKVPWRFNKPQLYMHHFDNVQKQVDALGKLDQKGRYELLRSQLLSASAYYQEIKGSRIDLDPHGNGEHITPWLDAINRYARSYLD